MNLLEETINILKKNGKSQDDVRWVGNKSGYITWEEFKQLANRRYDNGYGAVKVNEKLVVVGDDWWLERHNYDGAEWWEYKTLPTKGKHIKFCQKVDSNDYYDKYHCESDIIPCIFIN